MVGHHDPGMVLSGAYDPKVDSLPSAVPLLRFKELLLHYAFETCIMRPAPVHNAARYVHIVFGSLLAMLIS